MSAYIALLGEEDLIVPLYQEVVGKSLLTACGHNDLLPRVSQRKADAQHQASSRTCAREEGVSRVTHRPEAEVAGLLIDETAG